MKQSLNLIWGSQRLRTIRFKVMIVTHVTRVTSYHHMRHYHHTEHDPNLNRAWIILSKTLMRGPLVKA